MASQESHALFQISLKIILKDAHGNVLILKDQPDGMLYGYYDLPGGRIANSEKEYPFRDIIDREVKEELGEHARVSVNDTVVMATRQHWYPDPTTGMEAHVMWVFFEGTYEGGLITISPEHENYKWVRLEDLNLEEHFIGAALEGLQQYLTRQKAPSVVA